MTIEKIVKFIFGFAVGIISLPICVFACPFVFGWYLANEKED